MPAEDKDFDDILADLGGGLGKYQKRLLYLLLGPVFLIMPFAFLTPIFVVTSPDHWCKTSQDITHTNLSIELAKWKSIFLPKEPSPYDASYMVPSSCLMYNFTEDQLQRIKDESSTLASANQTDVSSFAAELQAGVGHMSCTDWVYDQSEFISTAVTDNNWVCDKWNYASDIHTLGTAGLILGTAIFSAIGDFYGRKFVMYVGTAILMIFSLLGIPTSHIFPLFGFFKLVYSFGMLPLFQSPMNILCEISEISQRGLILGFACVAWSLGQCIVPLVGWLIPHWKILKAVSMAPFVFVFFTWNIMPESPRWLITKGRTKEATAILRKIAETNNVIPPDNLEQNVEKVAQNVKTDSLGYISLFSSCTLALRTLFITIGFTASAFVYYQMVINVSNMHGNTFVNMFLLGLVEGPGNVIGVVMANKLGRRWTHFILLGLNALLFMSIVPLTKVPLADELHNPINTWVSPLISFICMTIKMNISGAFLVAYIQAMEIFPTCIRQSGIGFCSLISQIISIGGPHVIALGQTDVTIPYLVMFMMCLLGALAVLNLPETNNFPLPETLEDAAAFGKDQKFCSWGAAPQTYEAPPEQKNIIKGT